MHSFTLDKEFKNVSISVFNTSLLMTFNKTNSILASVVL